MVAPATISVPRKPILGYKLLNEASWTALGMALAAEFIMTAAFIFLATGMVISGCNSTGNTNGNIAGTSATVQAPPGSCFLGSTTLLNIAFAFGFSIFIAVFVAATFSGGHINPAVTVAFMLTRKISLLRGVLYVAVQLAGACLGSAFVLAMNGNGFRAAIGAANRLNAGIALPNAWLVETLLTFILVLVVFAATDSVLAVQSLHIPALAPFAIGVTVFLCHLVALPVDGCSVNPARSFGTSAVAGNWDDHWIFWVGPIGGGIIAAITYETVLRDQSKSKDQLGEATVGLGASQFGQESRNADRHEEDKEESGEAIV